MKTKLLLFLLFSGLVVSSCKKSAGDKPDDEKNQVKLPVKITEVRDNQTWVTDLSYDSQNRLVLVKGGSDQLAFSYDGALLKEISQTGASGQVIRKLVISYNSERPVSAVETRGGTSTTFYYTYVDGRVTKIETQKMGSGKGKRLEYANGNLTREVNLEDADQEQRFEYNSSKNIFYNCRLPFVPSTYYAEFFVSNAMTAHIVSEDPRVQTTHNYLLDTDGFPKSAIRRADNPLTGEEVVTEVTYAYEMKNIP